MRCVRFLSFGAAAGLAFSLLFAAPALAAEPAKADADAAALQTLQTRLQKLPPAQALAQYQKFLGDNPNLAPQMSLRVRFRIADLAEAAHQPTDALWQFRQGNLFGTQQALDPLLADLEKHGQDKEAVDLLQKTLTQMPTFLADDDFWHQFSEVYDRLLVKLVAQKRYPEALQWAKLRFVCCADNKDCVEHAMDSVAQTWGSIEPARTGLNRFVLAEKQTTRLNPLSAVALPRLDPAQVQATLNNLAGDGNRKTRISLLLAAGRLRPAMDEACRMLLQAPAAPSDAKATDAARAEGLSQVCRVFKAADLNLVRANAFAAYLATNQGANPLAQFFPQYPEPPTTTPAAVSDKPDAPPDAAQILTTLASLRVAAPAPVPFTALTVPAVLPPLIAHDLSAEDAWRLGLLSPDDVEYIFQQYRNYNPWGVFNTGTPQQHKDEDLCRDLGGVLVSHAYAHLSDVSVKGDTLVWAGDHCRVSEDARAVPLLQAALATAKTPERHSAASEDLYLAVERLGWYYNGVGDYQAARDHFLTASQYFKDAGWIADFTLLAARDAVKLGDWEKAKELYGQVSAGGNGWLTGAAIYDQAKALVDQGKHEEARNLLQQVVKGDGADQSHVALLAVLGRSYYETGDLKKAREACEQAVTLYRSLSDTRPGSGLEDEYNTAQDLLRLMDQWSKAAFVCEPPLLQLVVGTDTQRKEPVILQFDISSFRPTPLTVTSDNPNVKARINDGSWAEYSANFESMKEIIVEVALNALKQEIKAVLTVTSSDAPNFQVYVPIHIVVAAKATNSK